MNYAFDAAHGPEYGGGAILDRDAFQALEAIAGDDDPGLVGELVQLFLDDSQVRMSQVKAALDKFDAEVLGSAAHALKSSSANVGACTFASACGELERVARAHPSSGVAEIEQFARRALGMYVEVREALQVSGAE